MSVKIILISILGALLYRLGGIGKPFNTKVRDCGIPSCMLLLFILNNNWHPILLLCALLMFAAQTTYFKKKANSKWYNWVGVGFLLSICMLPYTIAVGNYSGFFLRSAIVILFTTLWSELIQNVWLEEGGRGFIQIVTLPLLFI